MKFYGIFFLTYFALLFSGGNSNLDETKNTRYELYNNLDIESSSAMSNVTGNTVFPSMPFDINYSRKLKKWNFSFSLRYARSGNILEKSITSGETITDRKKMENIDLLKHLTIIYKKQLDFMPFFSYYTPYKSKHDIKGEYEIIRKNDTFSFGAISNIDNHEILFSIDNQLSTYSKITSQETSNSYSGAFSARALLNIYLDRNSEAFFGAVSPVFLEYNIDDLPSSKKYFNNLILNGGLNYYYRENRITYSLNYREFDKYYDSDFNQVNYKWVFEHKIIASRKINRNVLLAFDYKLTPSYYYKDSLLKGYKHDLGVFLGYELKNLIWNFYYSDSRILSDENFKDAFFQMDLLFSFK